MDATLNQMIDFLITKTSKGEVIWNKSDSTNEYYVIMDSGRITTRIFSLKNNFGLGYTQMAECIVENKKGDTLISGRGSVDSEDGSILYSLYDSAFRSYTDKDHVISDMMKQLEGAGPIGENNELPF